ncbi:MAG TPA: CehA/McbA family metallohydrolase [Myxococcota bacterium]|nr:CehA/McbA family metallohydrolase [Myxococcota bacterium]
MRRLGASPGAVLLLAAACSPATPNGPYARARVITGLDDAIGGEKAMARPGDIVLENDHLRLGILAGRTSMGPGLFGGSVVDADLQWNDAAVDGGDGRDQWNEMFPTINMNVPQADSEPTVTIVQEGGPDEAAIVRVTGKGAPFLDLLQALWPLVQMPDMWISHDYIAEPGVPWVTMRTTVTFQETDEPVTEGEPVEYPTGGLDVVGDGLDGGLIAGDFFLSGGSVDVFAPGIGFDEDGAVYQAAVDGVNTFAQPFEFPFVAGTGKGISYGIVPKAGSAYVPLFTSSQTVIVSGKRTGNGTRGRFLPTDAFTYERYFMVGDGDVASIVDQYVEARHVPYGTVEGKVIEQGTAWPMTRAQVLVFEPGAAAPWSSFITDVRPDDTLADGSFTGRLPEGTWELLFHEQGRPDSARIPVQVRQGDVTKVVMEAPRPGTLTFAIRDEVGRLVPGKVTVFRSDKQRPSTRVPAYGDSFIAGDPEWVLFADSGEGEAALPDGDYYVVASRGIEYEVDRSDTFRIDATRSRHLDLQVVRSVDTEGWISADLHVHSAPSHDSGVTLPDRVRTMVAEGVEFFSATDHDFLTDFAPVVEEMGLEEWVQTAVGIETTTIEQGHFLAFPLRKHYLGDAGGALDWYGMPPADIIGSLRDMGHEAGAEPLVFVAHPRDGILGYFDQYGFDPFAGSPGSPSFSTPLFYQLAGDRAPVNKGEFGTLDYDAMEMFTAKRLDTHRTPTAVEAAEYQEGYLELDETEQLQRWFTRTMEEQQALLNDTVRLDGDNQGVIDDWFTTLNLGYRITAIGNSDTHGMTSVEAGCPRNFVMSETDDPAFIDDQAIADAIRAHHVVASYGPFVQVWVEDAQIGDEVAKDGPVDVEIEVQAPSWIDVDRVELYENGTLVQEWDVPPSVDNLRFHETTTREPDRDAWYVVIVSGGESLAPVVTEVEIPPIPLDEAVTGALGGLEVLSSPAFAGLLVPTRYPKKYPVLPFAITNPVWVDVDGGGWTAPGRPAWLREAP